MRTSLRRAPLALSLVLALALAAACSKESPRAVTGRVTGLVGSGLVLSNGLGPPLAVGGDGVVSFDGTWKPGTPIAIAVASQPTAPRQTCTVVATHDQVTASDELFAVVCTTDRFAVGGTVSGLAGAGLVLQDAGADDLAVTGNGGFTFATPVASGAPFAVTVKTQPSAPAQTCTVAGGTGTLVDGAVGSVAVTCATDRHALGGSVSGLAGSGLVLRNGGVDLAVTANGTFAFPAPLESGASYAVTVAAQPVAPAQTCTVTAGAGTVGAAPVDGVRVACATRTFAVGGTVSGLAGAGLRLRQGGADELAVDADGAFTFSRAVAAGGGYAVTISAQPTAPAQRCVVAGAQGTVVAGDVTGVAVSCSTQAFPVGGDVTGLDGAGLVLRQGGGDDLAVAARGAFAFATPVASGAPYDVAVAAQPTSPWQTCAVTSGGAGTLGAGPVSDVRVACTTDTFPVGGAVSGLAGGAVVLANGADTLAVSSDGPFTLSTVASGATYAVSVRTQPTAPSQTCAVAAGTGVVAGAAIGDVAVTCSVDHFQVGGAATGMPPAGVTVTNGADALVLDFDGPFTLSTVASGAPYDVQVTSVPATLACTVTGGAGTVGDGPVTTVAVACGCAVGRADCDGNPGNGCEVDTTSSDAHCGGCGVVCGSGTTCVAGTCTP